MVCTTDAACTWEDGSQSSINHSLYRLRSPRNQLLPSLSLLFLPLFRKLSERKGKVYGYCRWDRNAGPYPEGSLVHTVSGRRYRAVPLTAKVRYSLLQLEDLFMQIPSVCAEPDNRAHELFVVSFFLSLGSQCYSLSESVSQTPLSYQHSLCHPALPYYWTGTIHIQMC